MSIFNHDSRGVVSRRELLRQTGIGLGALALAPLMNSAGLLSASPISPVDDRLTPLASKAPPFAPKAKHVIHIFLNGGCSHIDTFDPKPELDKYAGKEIPIMLSTERKTGAALPSPFKFQHYGESGIEVSEIFSHVGEVIDEFTVLRSLHADIPNHEPSLLLMNCGDGTLIRPSLGSWATYGLGTENQNLPAFVAMCPGGYPIQESQNWQSGFLPGVYQGTYIDSQHSDVEKLIENVRNHRWSEAEQRRQLDLMQTLNQQHLAHRGVDPQLEAHIHSFELAYAMQREAAEAFDVSREPAHVLEAYGEGHQARQILIARRLVERGVRFVQVWHGAGQPWDNHDDIEVQHRKLAGQIDRAIAALIRDLKSSGLLEETLVMIGGEFGRTPTVELPASNNAGKVNGRDHNHYGFTMLLAGGGVKRGFVYGATDEFGFQAVENRVHVHDLHATILHLLGFDHERFTYRYAGRDFRLTDVHGRVISDVLA